MPAFPRVLLPFVLAACPLLSAPRDPAALRAALASHDLAVHIHDPFITLQPDGRYYLTGTTLEAGMDDIVGIYRGLVAWEPLLRLRLSEDTSWINLSLSVKHRAGNVPAIADERAQAELADTACTLNRQGPARVPLDVPIAPDGEVSVRAKDPRYASPGPEEAQKFQP
jgi:hypothetical protein